MALSVCSTAEAEATILSDHVVIVGSPIRNAVSWRHQRSAMSKTVHARTRQHPTATIRPSVWIVQSHQLLHRRLPHLPTRELPGTALCLQQHDEQAGSRRISDGGRQWKATNRKCAVSVQ